MGVMTMLIIMMVGGCGDGSNDDADYNDGWWRLG